MPESKITRIGYNLTKLPAGPCRDICEVIADLFWPHGLNITITNLSDHWSVVAARPGNSEIWAGVVIDGNYVIYDVYARDGQYEHLWIDRDGHLFVAECDLNTFDPVTIVPQLLSILPQG